MNPYLTASMASPPQHYPVGNPPLQQQQQYQQQQQQHQQQVPSQLSLLQRQQLLQQQEHMRLQQFQQEHQRQQQMANANTNVPRSHESVTDASIFTSLPSQQSPPQQQQPQQQQQQYNTTANTYPAKQNWDILTGPNAIDDPLALISPDGSLIQMPRWDSYDLGNLPPVQIAPRAKNLPVAPLSRTPDYMTAQQHPSMRHNYIPQQQQQQQQQQQNMLQHPHLVHNEYLLDTPSPVPTMSSLDISVQQQQQHHQQQQQQLQQQQQQQQQMSTSPVNVPEYLQSSCSPEMPIKASPIEHQLSWASWEESSPRHNDDLAYATPAHTHTSFDEGSRDDVDFTNTKRLKVFTSSKKDDDGEFRKGQQFYLNIHLNPEDQERFRYLRIPAENIVLPCKADSSGRVGLNASGKRSSDAMSLPTSAQEEDVLSLKLTTFLEPEHRMVVPCGRCKDKTPEILRFHPGVNGKPMIDENGMVTLRDGQVKLIASAWCASTSHHRGPGTKFSFQVELTSMTQYQEPVLVYEGRSDEVEIYASHGRDKGTRIANKNEKASKSHSPPLERGSAGPPSPAKTASSSPPSSPSSSMAQYDTGPVKKRREDPPMTPPLLDSDLPPTIKSLEPRKGPICRENHVIIIGQNFARGMTPMFGRDFGTVIDINPYYIECTTPRYPHTETVRLWLYHNDNYIATDKTYEFTDEQAQSDMEQLLRNLVQSDGEAGDAGSYLALMERLAGLPSSTDISGQSQSNGSTMLHNSVLLGYQAGVNLLIEEGIELDVEDDAGLTALDYAIYTNNVEIAGTLLSAGSMLSSERLDTLTLRPTQEMSTMLMDLCGVDLPTSPADQVPSSPVEEISSSAVPLGSLIQETILEETEPTEDESALESPPTLTTSHTASQPRPVPQRSARPLSIATVSTHSTGMVSLAPTMSTMAPSATSSTQSRSTMMGRPANHSSKGLENIWQGAKKGSLSLVKYHLEKEPNLINAPWKFDGRSVLSSACASSQPQELVEFLVMRGAHVNSADTFYKRTALHTLCEEGGLSQDDWRIVVSQADQEANERDVLAAMRFLLDKGAVVDAKNHWKETALMRLFAGRDCPLMVQELYSRGADSRLKSSKDAYPHGTALSYAAYYGRIKSLKWMIENDLLLNDEATIKDAIRWAKASKGESSQGSQQVPVMQSASMVRRKEERKAEAIRLLESWLGESGQTKRKTLARELAVETADGWWQRMSGIVDESKKPGLSSSAPSSSSSSSDPTLAKLPAEMRPLWKDVHALSESLVSSSDQVSSSSSRMKWNPLTMLRK